MTKAIRYFRPDMLFAITPWHLAKVCGECSYGIRRDYTYGTISPVPVDIDRRLCSDCGGEGYRAACGYTPPEGWVAEVKERGPRCVECEEMVEEQRENTPATHL